MNKYEIIGIVGEGAYGIVIKQKYNGKHKTKLNNIVIIVSNNYLHL